MATTTEEHELSKRICQVMRRKAVLDGFLKGHERDTSAEAATERIELDAEWMRLSERYTEDVLARLPRWFREQHEKAR